MHLYKDQYTLLQKLSEFDYGDPYSYGVSIKFIKIT